MSLRRALDTVSLHHANNIATLRRSPLSEISGSLGDLGTLLPIMIALAVNGSISLSSTLVFSGVWNILTGVAFGVPLTVQPMKAIAAVAISQRYSIQETVSAGFTTSGVVLILSITGLLQWFTHRIPVPVIKGIQLGAALTLIISSGTTLLQPLGLITPSLHDNHILTLLAFLFLLTTQSPSTHIPYALLIFTLGLLLALLSHPILPSLTFFTPHLIIPSKHQFLHGALGAGIGQIPLTTLNSIIAIPSLCVLLLPHSPAPDVTHIGLSVSLMNLIGGWFGAMPVCHGSGGLAGQYRFGARSGASIIMLGTCKLLLGLAFGDSLLGLLGAFPKSLLGVMVIAAGLELANVGENLNTSAVDLMGRDSTSSGLVVVDEEERKRRWTIMLVTVAGILAFKNDGVGFVVGMLCHYSYGIRDGLMRWRSRHGGTIWQRYRGSREERRTLLDR